MAHLKAGATQKDDRERLHWKLALVKMLYRKGYGREDILELFRFLDWVLTLPEDLEQSFSRSLAEFEEEANMPYVTSVERLGIKKGRKEGLQKGLEKGLEKGLRKGTLETARENILEILETRFGSVPEPITLRIQSVEDVTVLKRLLKLAVTAASPDDFERAL